MKTFQITVPEALDSRLQEQKKSFTTRNALILHLLNRGLEAQK
ncbi:MAG: hypothetical protein Q8P05_06060 [Candidatus Diapherotrites archaeon]|nr:hypothetical protein [Candidatus Diapherotrites archaeon]